MSDRQQGEPDYVSGELTNQELAIPALETALEKTTGLGARIDLVLAMVRTGLFTTDTQLVVSSIERAAE